MRNWVRLQIELEEGYSPSYSELLLLIKSLERELKGFPQVEKVVLEDYLLGADLKGETERGATERGAEIVEVAEDCIWWDRERKFCLRGSEKYGIFFEDCNGYQCAFYEGSKDRA